MKITHLSTYDVAGGAARAAYRLHVGLRSAGQDSRMLVLFKSSSDPTVIEFDPPRDIPTRIRRGWSRRLIERRARNAVKRKIGATTFSDDLSQHGADVLRRLPETDVLNLHWVAGLFDYQSFFRRLPQDLPIVWTLHDMNAFTGGCHYDEGCDKFTKECGACPQLHSSNQADLTRHVWHRKRNAFATLAADRLQIVTPSRWLGGQVNRSSLFSRRAVTVIPNGIDVESFRPRDRFLAREKYDIPQNAKVLLFVADSTAEKRKGLGILREALAALDDSEEYFFVAIGRELKDQGLRGACKLIDYLADEQALSSVYSAADVFVIPSLQDNLPNTAIEAVACGTPVIGSNVGGIAEIVRDGRTGFTVPPGDWQALAKMIREVLENDSLRSALSAECRRVAVEEYSLTVQAHRYEELYKEILAKSSR